MGKKREPKEIIGKLREAEVMLVQGGTVADACRRIGLRCRAITAAQGVWWAEDGSGSQDEGVGA